MTTTVATDRAEGVLHLRLARPERKNALTTEMYQAMADALTAAADEREVRSVLITGTDGSFCAGNDIGDFQNTPMEGDNHPVLQFMRALAGCPKPVVAAVRGPAVGVGATMLLHCDLVFAASSARFCFPFVNLGICPEFAATYLMPRFMGHVRAAELLLLGEPFDAAQALACGLINAIHDDDQVEAHGMAVARKLAGKPPNAMRVSKQLLKRWPAETIASAIREEAAHFMPMLKQDEAREAFAAFAEKRAPDFSRFF